MSLPIVDMNYVTAVFGPLRGLADDDSVWDKYNAIDVNDKDQVAELAKQEIKPYFQRFTSESQDGVRRSFQYFLSKEDTVWGGIFCSLLLPINYPTNVRQFFIWLYEALFDSSDYLISNIEDFREVEDPEIPWRLFPPKERAGEL